MKLSIIIPTYNEEEYLPGLLESIKGQEFNDYEIIVADANSKDKTRKIAENYGCKIVKGGLPAEGRNNGAAIAKGELLLFLDADVILTNGYLKEAVEEFERENLGIAITQMIPLSTKKRDKILHEFANRFMILTESIKPHGAGCCGILTRKELHEKVGGFDESLDFGEDTDYIERIGKISKFKVLRKPRLLVSIRRLEKEGLKDLAFKYTKSTLCDFLGKKLSASELNYTYGHSAKRRKRILYSVCGEGMGHAIRSGVILKELVKDYDVLIFASDRAYKYLKNKFDNVYEIYGFNTVYENNEVNDLKTFLQAMKTFPRDLKENLSLLYKMARDFKPEVVISDFEFYASLISNMLRIPLISVDNMHVITECNIEYPKKYRKDKLKAAAVIRSFIIRPKRYIITSYFFPKIKNPEKVVMFPPILRKKIMNLKPYYGDHILVYQTSKSNIKLLKTLKKINRKFIIYGFNKNKIDGNLYFRRFNESEFFNDLKSAAAVITNGGFTLISEALYLKKPIYSVPVKGQFEQIINAVYLEKLGYGEFHEEADKKSIETFLEKLPVYRKNLEKYEGGDNTALIRELKRTIEEFSR
ncbi:MAG TPA: glycosyltransferase family protein [Methanothermobacter sp.]|nr:glycosyltransferase [Methanothermobacter sp. MT-2]HHW05336.1 glycosyltransferase [Methanothermobacter sp.]HOK73091.1 glycosyltransferase family protein [Methanothermobacter sp.]HOL68723.1 glycosyltransferase family protein [Methanothermobacter sp.]HPQ04616.1 glycosyltransferase family protein [Methanothermobacter sp.]